MRRVSPHDRRRFRRLPATELNLAWRPRNRLFARYRNIQGHDFTREGVAVTAAADTFSEGDRIELQLELVMAGTNLTAQGVVAEVVNVARQGHQARVGLAFDVPASRRFGASALRARLGRMEGILERSEKQWLRSQPLESITGLTG
ncbi:PilZ domain-containing protein [Marinobacter halodurans]|uniref:PilZ domain-containing protein n=1 Tax=Marinobacter halodurans TaxID=2528979 RepID=A0ABY1ZH19_9GAMM|nr:PilZ domain-containing protein [Marinobacter halodurans]TBW52174.1 PilZ domain-containing protein [Marinobacter halodurans]